jgi:hypothetical protein
MAIAIERKTQKINWMGVAIGIFALVVLMTAVYFFFFAANPFIERVIVPATELPGAEGLTSVATSDLSPQTVVGELQLFQDPIPPPTPGAIGRPNPFLPL